MKVLIDVRPLTNGAHSGIPVFTQEITQRLIKNEADSYELLYPGLRKQRLPDWSKRSNVSVLDWKIPGKLFDASTKWLRRPDMGKQVSAEIILSPHLNNLEQGSLPRVLTIHDLSFVHHPNFFSAKQKIWHSLQNWRSQIQRANHLVAVSHYTKEDLIKTLGINAEKISVIYPGISNEFKPLDPHDPDLLAFQKRHAIHAPYFLYLGALETRKNVLQLIQAFNLLRTNSNFKGYELILAGTPGHGARAIAKAATRSPSSRAIRILSRLADGERKFLYNGAVAFACTSFFEGFGFPVLEAQACGVPVVASQRTSFIETLGNSAQLVSPWKQTELADALISLAMSSSTRSQAIRLGFENAKRFNWDTAATTMHRILEKTHRSFYG